ncbi:MAG: EF-hand domain-containing protein [Desulfovibrio sp.]|nr:EF-hand domain-containing protein [Desulfovibrio sp.]MBI4961253.1 EF-hand domain-containing protein [Desulfovibrio sp.]
MRAIAILSLLALVACATPAKKPAYDAADANKDGKISRQEFRNLFKDNAQDKADEMFNRHDTNRDGNLTGPEYDLWDVVGSDDSLRPW